MTNMNMIQSLNSALDNMLDSDPDVIIFGEDVGYFGGVFRVTDGLQEKYGAHRVFDSPLAEGGIGAIGPAMAVALITTFYGAVLANLIFNPFAEKIKSRNKENSKAYELMIEGLCMLHQKKHPFDVKDKLTAYIAAEERNKYFPNENE